MKDGCYSRVEYKFISESALFNKLSMLICLYVKFFHWHLRLSHKFFLLE